ncbi:MAG: CoA ester lyase [Variovorax sp.]
MHFVTYLFVPGDRPDRFSKAVATGADVVVLDLEDAVTPDRKGVARSRVADALATDKFRACVRINGADTQWFEEDLRLLALPGVMAVMLPKAETAQAFGAIADAAGASNVAVIPIVETARGLSRVESLANGAGVHRLAFGSVDFQLDLGIEGDEQELLFARSQIVLASRLAGVVAPIDGVTLAVNDAAQAHRDALRARRLGFGGKLCIHPAQIAPVREAFAPDAQAIAWANGVLAAAAQSTAGALTYEGRLIDKPVIDRARTLIDRAYAAKP